MTLLLWFYGSRRRQEKYFSFIFSPSLFIFLPWHLSLKFKASSLSTFVPLLPAHSQAPSHSTVSPRSETVRWFLLHCLLNPLVSSKIDIVFLWGKILKWVFQYKITTILIKGILILVVMIIIIIMIIKELHSKLGVLAEFFPPSGVSGGVSTGSATSCLSRTPHSQNLSPDAWEQI